MGCCEHNINKPGRCRKAARFVVAYNMPFGDRIGPHGAEPVYLAKESPRCAEHAEPPGNCELIGKRAILTAVGGFKAGDRVAYSAQFLRSTGQQAGEAGHGRATVKHLEPLGDITLAVLEWEGADLPERVNAANLAKVGPNSKFCAC